MKILSVIIPSYNSEKYLDKCITSLLSPEHLEKIEIIVVNDGSTDTTPEIANKYCEIYPNVVKLISQENKGHGGALNTGCAAATGKYLKVIDADDWIITENLKAFISFLENTDSDVVLTHHLTTNISTGEIKRWRCYPESFGKAYNFEEIMQNWKSFDRSLTFHGITYNTAFYKENSILLSEHVFYEDHEFATIPCCKAQSITPLDLFLYNYRIGDVEQSVSDKNQLKRIGHTEAVLKRLCVEFPNLALSDAAENYYCMKVQGLLLSYLVTVLLIEKDKAEGRKCAGNMIKLINKTLPQAYLFAKRQYKILKALNHLRISKKSFETILNSKIYNKIRSNHNFD